MKIVVASTNSGKIKEIESIFKGHDVYGIKSLIPNFNVKETGKTFKENAILKAEAASYELKLPVISDDSGISVDALGGAPGVYSARYAGERATDDENNKKLLEALEGEDNRSAHFTSVIALAIPGHETRTYEGILKGKILTERHGQNGFGYDPLFETEDGQKLGEISPDDKNKISHRKKALELLRNDQDAIDELKKG